MCKYMLWNRYFIHDDTDKIIEELLKNNLLYKNDKGDYLVTGLHLAVGDNTFTIGKSGKHYRKYNKACVMQAFYVTNRWQRILELKSIQCPLLDKEVYWPTMIGNGKYMAKISFVKKDRDVIYKKYCKRGQ